MNERHKNREKCDKFRSPEHAGKIEVTLKSKVQGMLEHVEV